MLSGGGGGEQHEQIWICGVDIKTQKFVVCENNKFTFDLLKAKFKL